MTPYEKAKELVIMYSNVKIMDYEGEIDTLSMEEAKQCAMICVDEVLVALKECDNWGDITLFYSEVKSEIERL